MAVMLLPKALLDAGWTQQSYRISFDFGNAASGLALSHHNIHSPIPSLPLLSPAAPASSIVHAWLILSIPFLAATFCSGRRPNIYDWSGTTLTQQQSP
jgi:hypothetical protein